MDTINQIITLCDEIEQRQARLRELVKRLTYETQRNVQDETHPDCAPDAMEVNEATDTAAERELPQPATTHASDLRKMFTINDRFRFRRELFGGNDDVFNTVIRQLSASPTFADAESYISSLDFDKDSDIAKEFIAVVSTHFNGYNL